MNQGMIDQTQYADITNNQLQVIQEIQITNQHLTNVNHLSNKLIEESNNNFKKGITAISNIRNNLDEIHKLLTFIAKHQKQQQKA